MTTLWELPVLLVGGWAQRREAGGRGCPVPGWEEREGASRGLLGRAEASGSPPGGEPRCGPRPGWAGGAEAGPGRRRTAAAAGGAAGSQSRGALCDEAVIGSRSAIFAGPAAEIITPLKTW